MGGGWTLIYTDKDLEGNDRAFSKNGLGDYGEYAGVNSNIPKDSYVALAQNTASPFRFYTDITTQFSYFIKMDTPDSVSSDDYWSYLTMDGTNITNYTIWMGTGYSSACYQAQGGYDYSGTGCSDKGSFNHIRAISYGDIYDWCNTTSGSLWEGTYTPTPTVHSGGRRGAGCGVNNSYESGSNTWSMWIK